jgi:hypothetical protein
MFFGHRSSNDYLSVVAVRGEGNGETVVTTPGRLVYHSRVVVAYPGYPRS